MGVMRAHQHVGELAFRPPLLPPRGNGLGGSLVSFHSLPQSIDDLPAVRSPNQVHVLVVYGRPHRGAGDITKDVHDIHLDPAIGNITSLAHSRPGCLDHLLRSNRPEASSE